MDMDSTTPVETIDLESYLNKYAGYTRHQRLMLMLNESSDPHFQMEVGKILLSGLVDSSNMDMYVEACQRMTALTGVECTYDLAMVETVNKRTDQTLKRLESELNAYKTNLIKESIRMGHNDIGQFYFQKGDLQNALKSFIRARDFCASNQQLIEMCMNVIKVSIHLGNYQNVSNYAGKAEQALSGSEKSSQDAIIVSQLHATNGLYYLHERKYNEAAKKFLLCKIEIGSTFNQVLHADDIAMYGSLCALATFSRNELKELMASNSSFKLFLENVPSIRNLIEDFDANNYMSCFQCLQKLQSELRLDLHLKDHVAQLYQEIRNRALVQYCSPYFTVDMNIMAKAFSATVCELESEIAQLIRGGQIAARIDSKNKILYARQDDQRGLTYHSAFELGRQFIADTKAVLLRMNLVKNEISVGKSNSRAGPTDPAQFRHHSSGNPSSGY